jgi:pimeloyl-ACP methyl ester carboxylesterase
MPEVVVEDATLHVEIDGEGDPVTIMAHGLSNTCRELAMLTPFLEGTSVRFCFRGHGHSSAPEAGYLFSDFARDVDAVAREYGATRAIGTSLGAGAICNLIAREPGRFERLIFLFPAALDFPFELKERFRETADMLETTPRDQLYDEAMNNPDRLEQFAQVPWFAEVAREMLEATDPVAMARVIREVIEDYPVPDREMLRPVQTPTMIFARHGDPVHPVEVAEGLAEAMPNAELILFETDDEIIEAIPDLLRRAHEFLQ